MIPSKFKALRQRPERPSHKEVNGKLAAAKALIQLDRWRPAEYAKMQANWDEIEAVCSMDTAAPEDQTSLLLAALNEITPERYCGGRPPDKADEKSVRGREMWEFRWVSVFFGREMYLKFCVGKGDEANRRLYMLSLHPDRPVQ